MVGGEISHRRESLCKSRFLETSGCKLVLVSCTVHWEPSKTLTFDNDRRLLLAATVPRTANKTTQTRQPVIVLAEYVKLKDPFLCLHVVCW